MSIFCEIIDKRRGLLKPQYFPLLSPISLAEVKRVRRINGKPYKPSKGQRFIPIVTVTSNASVHSKHELIHHVPSSTKHIVQKGFRYLVPWVESNADLMKILKDKQVDEENLEFIYTIEEDECALVLPTELGAAVRDGEITSITLSVEFDKILIKQRKGTTIELAVSNYSADEAAELFKGKEPSEKELVNDESTREVSKNHSKLQSIKGSEKYSSLVWREIVINLDAFRPYPMCSSWKNVLIEHSALQTDDQFDAQFKRLLQRLNGNQNFCIYLDVTGEPFVITLPQPVEVETQVIDLSRSLPGVIRQPNAIKGTIGFPVEKIVASFRPLVSEIDKEIVNVLKKFNADRRTLQKILERTEKQTGVLPSLEDVPSVVKGLYKLLENGLKRNEGDEFQYGVTTHVGDVEIHVPGKFMEVDNYEIFVPGTVTRTSTGLTFVPGLVLRTNQGDKFLPGFILKDEDNAPVFVAGQNIPTEDGEKFIQGQFLWTNKKANFMPGQTIITAEGIKFVPGQIVPVYEENYGNKYRFVPGQIITTSEGPNFVAGLFHQNPSTGEVSFFAGQSIFNERGDWEFVPGQHLKTEDGNHIFVPGKDISDEEGRSHFVPGQMIIDQRKVQRFLPGMTLNDEKGNRCFIPGIKVETNDGIKFLEGLITITGSFAAGKVSRGDDNTIKLIHAKKVDDLIFHNIHAGISVSCAKEIETFGYLVRSTQGVEFFPDQASIRNIDTKIPGRQFKNSFVPGTMIDGKFTPGFFSSIAGAKDEFVPGRIIETIKGPKFVPGQIFRTRYGPQFVPGQTAKIEKSPKFIAGQTIETKCGPKFVPGQLFFINEENAQFVLGQVVDTVEGLRFVPGHVLDARESVIFEPSEIIETEEGLKFITANLNDDPVGNNQFTLQGFEVNLDEVKMIVAAHFVSEMAVDPETVLQLVEGGKSIGNQCLGDDCVRLRYFVLPEEENKFTDIYYSTTKLELERSISEILDKLGGGLCDPVPYDTAWVARVPQFGSIKLPAFPLSIQWLRDNQSANGAWGSSQFFHAHSSTLNTLAAIIALAQWDYPEDKMRIKRGCKALWDLTNHLSDETHESIGFELILPALIQEALKYDLDIPCDHYKMYEEKGLKKLNLISYGFKKYGGNKPATWWHSLEVLGDKLEIYVDDDDKIEFFPSMLVNGSVGASPSATAYLLRLHRLKGMDVPAAAEYLKKIYSFHQGGISQVFPIDIFELSFSVDYFLKAGFSAKHPLFKEAINRLSERCISKEMIGFSSHFKVADSDDMAIAFYVLHHAGCEVSAEHLLPFFNGIHISTFINETNLSFSANINVLRTLRLFQNVKEIDDVIQKIVICLEPYFSTKQVSFDDKWHSSPYYSSSRAVFALHGLRNDLVEHCLNFFLKNQNTDGGWGKHGFSTAEETAYVALALSYSLKCGYSIPNDTLEKASRFLFTSKCQDHASLWLGKVLYRPTLVADSAIVAAQYSLAETFKTIKVENILKEAQFEYIEFNLNIDEQENYHGFLLCPSPKFDLNKYSDQISRVQMYIVNRLIELELIKTDKSVVKPQCLKGSLYTLRSESSDEDIILHSCAAMAIFIYDDILDKNWQVFRNNPIIIKQAVHKFLEILQGKYENIDTIPSLDFPKFIPLCKLFFDLRYRIIRKQSDIEQFLVKVKEVFDSVIEDTFNLSNNLIMISSYKYLELNKFKFHAYFMIYLGFIIKGVNLSSFKDYTVFHKFENYGSKASCLISDILSFTRDADEGRQFDNYVLVKKAEMNCSIEDALCASIELYNKQVIKMYSLKKEMQNDPKYKNDQNLSKAIAVIENFIQGVLDFTLESERYQQRNTVSVCRKQLMQSDFSLVM